MDDNYSLWERNEARLQRELEERPICTICDQHIQDDQFYNINSEYICKSCMDTHFLVNTEDYIE